MRAVLLMTLGCVGCNQWFGITETQYVEPDAPPPIDAVGCSDSIFSAPRDLETTEFGYGPTLVSAQELWFSQTDGTVYKLYVQTRGAPGQPFGPRALASVNLGTDDDQDPNFDADALTIVWNHNSATYEAQRASVGEPFGPALVVASISAENVYKGIDLSVDALALYYVNIDGDLHRVTRESRDSVFGPPGPTLASGVAYPSVSPDQLELYFTDVADDKIHRRTRADTTVAFDPATDLALFLGDDPDVAADAETLVFQFGAAIKVSTRTCN